MKLICKRLQAAGLLLIFLFAAACSNSEFLALTDEVSGSLGVDDPEARHCRIRGGYRVPGNTLGPFDLADQKVLLNSNYGLKSSSVTGELKLSITIDRGCAQKNLKAGISKGIQRAIGPEIEAYEVVAENGNNLNQLVADLNNDPCVLYVNEASVMKTSADPAINQQMHLSAIGFTAVAEQIHGTTAHLGEKVVVAVIDTGVDGNHPDLRNNMWINEDEVPNNGRDDDGNGYVDDINGYNFANRRGDQSPIGRDSSHGSHVAGLAAAGYNNDQGGSGVLGRNVAIMGLNVFGSSQGATNADIENAIRYAADNGADVINMSLGGCGYTASTGQAISYAVNKGVVVIVAAGNSSQLLSTNPNDGRNCNGYGGAVFDTPASFGPSYPGMVTIGSVEAQNIGTKSSFSNYGSKVVELMAPGSESSPSNRGLYSTVPGGGYQRMMGTSMAAPVAAGAAAAAIGMLKSRGKNYSPGDIQDLLTESAQSYSSLNQYAVGGKSLKVDALVALIDQRYPGNPVDPSNPVEPVDPVDPGNPVEPVDPVNPGNPVEPVDPANPVQPPPPHRPCRPRRPGRPGHPGWRSIED